MILMTNLTLPLAEIYILINFNSIMHIEAREGGVVI